MEFLISRSTDWGYATGNTLKELIEKLELPNGFKYLLKPTNRDDNKFYCYIQISTVEQLKKFQQQVGHKIIIDGDEIEIYNGFRE